ncbi:hypothetical protein MMC07_007414 [Pseudocyphellaria aurata]|nr:hypothetical protein [Pseudocyphellaria aurata]
MQSEPTSTPKKPSNPEKNQSARQHSQHGLDEYALTSSLSPSGEDLGDLGDLGDRTRSARGAQAVHTVAVASGDVQICLQTLPNEVLTQILSHLPPQSLSDVSLVSRSFHGLVTTPHAWRIGFSRFFKGSRALPVSEKGKAVSDDDLDDLRSERRFFARLTPLASWRSEYIIRIRLLHSIARGKPAEIQGQGGHTSSRVSSSHNASAQVTYTSNLTATVSHLHATFGSGINKMLSRFIHGADELGSASISDPVTKRVDNWGSADAQGFSNFTEQFPGDAQYGLDAGNVIGVPNSMDVSHPYGMVYAEGYPGGIVYFRSVAEKRGRNLALLLDVSLPELGIPQLSGPETICSTWIAKSSNVPDVSGGLVGMLTGSSHGIVSSYSIGTNSLGERRLERGELTARWVLSPGVPITAIKIDDCSSLKRRTDRRIWAVVLNALGEVFYLTDFPERPIINRAMRLDERRLETLAWETGRTVCWTNLEPTRRTARPDPYHEVDVDGSYSPRSSWNGMNLSKAQIIAETREIETFIRQKPEHFRRICQNWDMRQRLEIDFASSDENGAGEIIIVIGCGLDEGRSVTIKNFTRCKTFESQDKLANVRIPEPPTESKDPIGTSSPVEHILNTNHPIWSFNDIRPLRRSSTNDTQNSEANTIEGWRTSVMQIGGPKSVQIATTALDTSTFALLTASEDPLLSMTGSSTASSPNSSPIERTRVMNSADIPGQRGRLMAAGTKTGIIIVWNVRTATLRNCNLDCIINPIRVIHTDSPEICSLALSALYLVHGGSDGLVQAWDPLASTTEPIRTLNSRFSSRARSRLTQSAASARGVGNNLLAAGAICLDPDPTILRGMVSLGTNLRYWSYSSSAAEQYKGNKRRRRRCERGSNQGGDRFTGTRRGAIKELIANEKLELERERRKQLREQERLAGRFGLDLLGPEANDEELMAYATLLSKEAAATDTQRRESASSAGDNEWSGEAVIEPVDSDIPSTHDDDADMAEAIRRSLEQVQYDPKVIDFGADPASSSIADNAYPIRYTKSKRKSSSASSPKKRGTGGEDPAAGGPVAACDLAFALRLSLEKEEESAAEGKGKGKGKG